MRTIWKASVLIILPIVVVGALVWYLLYKTQGYEFPNRIGVIANTTLALLTFFVVIASVFQDLIRQWLKTPDLELHITPEPPHFHKTKINLHNNLTCDCYYLRFIIENKGNTSAEQVEVYAASLMSESSPVQRFVPMNLFWSNVQKTYLPRIAPMMKTHCDFGHIINPEHRKEIPYEDDPEAKASGTLLSLDTCVKPNQLGHLIRPGNYIIEIVIVASNSKPKQYNIQLKLDGRWYESESEMFSKGITLKLNPK